MSRPRPSRQERHPRLHLVPVKQKDAKAFVAEWHRHHKPPAGAVFCVGAADDEAVLRAVAMVGRPVSRMLDDGQTLEVTRTATDGAFNANSLLYGAAWRAAQALGYTRLLTYTQDGESGASLRGAGWRVIAQIPPRKGWDCPSRPRESHGVDQIVRLRWEAPFDRITKGSASPAEG
ncbi:XF1762 family protein [Streptomyces bauhiniae]|uniref:XF1762 family protein n=1 Tax=Streptomyces bauhiniae TaxID=2340725 RepID=UPI0033252BD9